MSIDFDSPSISRSYVRAATLHRQLQDLDQDVNHPFSNHLSHFNNHLLSLNLSSTQSQIKSNQPTTFKSLLSKLLLDEPSHPDLADFDSEYHSKIQLENLDAFQLISKMKSGHLGVERTLKHFHKMASLSHKATGCLSDLFLDDLELAKSYDQLIQKAISGDSESKKKVDSLPLLGLPISIKGHISIKGKGNQRGFIHDILDEKSRLSLISKLSLSDSGLNQLLRTGQGPYIAESDALIISILRSKGALFYCKTVMPQSVMQLETNSNLWGVSLNPNNLNLSSGGSSGGESSLISSFGSPLGIGTDIGGSVRQPCSSTSLFGLRPTIGRLSGSGFRSTMPGNEGIIGTPGPMCRSLRDVKLIMKALVGEERKDGDGDGQVTGIWDLDPNCVRLPWKELDLRKCWKGRKIRIGFMEHDGVVRPHPNVSRALDCWREKLVKHPNVEVVQYDPQDYHRKAWDLTRELYFLDGGAVIKALASSTSEPLHPLTSYILSSPVRNHTSSEIWSLSSQREVFKKAYFKHFSSFQFDFLLCPTQVCSAPRVSRVEPSTSKPGEMELKKGVESSKYWNYTSFWNLVDYPSISFPSGIVSDSEKDQQWLEGQKEESSLGELDDLNRKEWEENKKEFDGIDIGLQLVGKRFAEEELLSALDILMNDS